MKIGIVGAGPAGMAAALEASRFKSEIHLWDANPNPGRKLAATGSGRCNLTNIQVEAGRYHTKHPQQLSKIFNQFGYPQFIAWLEDMGIFVTTTADGWVYPTSFSAQNVVDILQAQLNIRGVKIHPRSLITAITPTNNGFCLKTQDRQKQLSVDRLIIASGGPAAPQLGARENMYAVLKQLGHTVLPVKPALAPLLTDGGQFHKLQGVRLDAAVHLLKEGREIEKTTANIIFTGWGINGPGVMNLSYLVSLQEMQNVQLSIDFLPDMGEKLDKMLNEGKYNQLPISAVLKSFFPDKLVYFLLEKCGISPHKKISELRKDELADLQAAIHQQAVRVKGTKGFKDCQLSTGGVPLSEIDAKSMRSILIPGMALAGEVLDVNGPCGGYNLHWAFISGIIAGRHILE